MMFSADPDQSVFACAAGVSFASAVAAGLIARMQGQRPEVMASVAIYVNSARMRDQVLSAFQSGPAMFVPRVRLITELPADFLPDEFTRPTSAMQRRLELRQMVSALVHRAPEIAPLSAVPDLADSLFALIEEMADEAVAGERLATLDITDTSRHWERALRFLEIVTSFVGPGATERLGSAELFRKTAESAAQVWALRPPSHPVIIAGSTGSRGTTGLIMRAAARTSNCALVLPGFDSQMPDPVWTALASGYPAEDHPQYRYARLLADLGLGPGQVQDWGGRLSTIQADRNSIISLSLRPAPVTSQWLTEGPNLKNIKRAMQGVSLVEAPDARREAVAIALLMREAVEKNATVALITPDPELTRMVATALKRWEIVPDTSMGQPLGQTPPGRLMRQILRTSGGPPDTEALLALLKHPLVSSGGRRGDHLRTVRKLELWLRRERVPMVEPRHIERFSAKAADDYTRTWSQWVTSRVMAGNLPVTGQLEAYANAHFSLAMTLCAGPDDGASGDELWKENAGEALARYFRELSEAAPSGGFMHLREYSGLFDNLLKGREARNSVTPHPNVMIWGTLEARVMTPDRVILGGLNEGVWPEMPAADPWLNRQMRQNAGLLSPERKIGLSAHDYQQAVAAPEVFLTRALRDSEAETVPSRWLNRLSNLLDGLSGEGAQTLKEMKCRGATWVRIAKALESPATVTPSEPRPAPVVPIELRPRRLSVTDIARLGNDPYAYYARQILRLEPIDPLFPKPDARLRGIAFHEIAEKGLLRVEPTAEFSDEVAKLLDLAHECLQRNVPWPDIRTLWLGQLAEFAPGLLLQELQRRQKGSIAVTEAKVEQVLADGVTTLVCKADRIDRHDDQQVTIFDYKSGSLPSQKAIGTDEMQLMLEAYLASNGAFQQLGNVTVRAVEYLGIKRDLSTVQKEVTTDDIDRISRELEAFLANYFSRYHGYLSRRRASKQGGDYDHLARYGEWSDADLGSRVDL